MVRLDISAVHISDCCLTHAPLWMLNFFIVQFNQVLSKQVWGTAAWRRCLSLTLLLWLSQSHHLGNPPAWLAVHCFGPKLEPLGPIFRRKLFFIAPKTPQLLPVWPSPPHTSLQVIRPSFLLLMRVRLWGQAFKKSRSQPGLRFSTILWLLCLCSVHTAMPCYILC